MEQQDTHIHSERHPVIRRRGKSNSIYQQERKIERDTQSKRESEREGQPLELKLLTNEFYHEIDSRA